MNAGGQMVPPKRVGDLEVAQDLDFQRREWITERVGWAIMLVVIAATLIGLFGRGWLSAASAGREGGALRLRYERFARLFAPTQLTVVLAEQAMHGDTARVWIDRDVVQSMQVLDIAPRPERVVAGPDRFTYLFPVSASHRPVTITFQLQPQHPWWHTGWVGVPGGDAVQISQFVYP